MPRWASRTDTVSAACIAEFRRHGADWLDTSRTPGIDGLALYRGRVIPVEFKTVLSAKGRVQLTPMQHVLVARGWPLAIITSPADVVRVLQEVDRGQRTPA